MAIQINPLPLQDYDLTNPKALKVWQSQVAQALNQIQALLNQLSLAVLTPNLADLGSITTDKTVSCAGSAYVFVRFASSVTQTRTITLSGLGQGAIVMVNVIVVSGTLTLKMAGTDGSGNAYTIQSWASNTLTILDLVGTGVVIGTGLEFCFFGMSGFISTSSGPRLNFIAS